MRNKFFGENQNCYREILTALDLLCDFFFVPDYRILTKLGRPRGEKADLCSTNGIRINIFQQPLSVF